MAAVPGAGAGAHGVPSESKVQSDPSQAQSTYDGGAGSGKSRGQRRRSSNLLRQTQAAYRATFKPAVFAIMGSIHLFYPISVPVVAAVFGKHVLSNIDYWPLPEFTFFKVFNNHILPLVVLACNLFYFVGDDGDGFDGLGTMLALMDALYVLRIMTISLKYAFMTVDELSALHTEYIGAAAKSRGLLQAWRTPTIDNIYYQISLAAIDRALPLDGRQFMMYFPDSMRQTMEDMLLPAGMPILKDAARGRLVRVEVPTEQPHAAGAGPAPPTTAVFWQMPGTFVAESLIMQVSQVNSYFSWVPPTVATSNLLLGIGAYAFSSGDSGAMNLVAHLAATCVSATYAWIVFGFIQCGVTDYARRARVLRMLAALIEERATYEAAGGKVWPTRWRSCVGLFFTSNVRTLMYLFDLVKHVGYPYRKRVQLVVGVAIVIAIGFAGALLYSTLVQFRIGDTELVVFTFYLLATLLMVGRMGLDGVETNDVAGDLVLEMARRELGLRASSIVSAEEHAGLRTGLLWSEMDAVRHLGDPARAHRAAAPDWRPNLARRGDMVLAQPVGPPAVATALMGETNSPAPSPSPSPSPARGHDGYDGSADGSGDGSGDEGTTNPMMLASAAAHVAHAADGKAASKGTGRDSVGPVRPKPRTRPAGASVLAHEPETSDSRVHEMVTAELASAHAGSDDMGNELSKMVAAGTRSWAALAASHKAGVELKRRYQGRPMGVTPAETDAATDQISAATSFISLNSQVSPVRFLGVAATPALLKITGTVAVSAVAAGIRVLLGQALSEVRVEAADIAAAT